MSSGVVQEKVTSALLGALNGAKKKGQLKTESWPQLSLDAPKRPEWGDLASTVAMSLAASEQRTPHDIAQIIIDNLSQREQLFDRVEIARPGFLNLTLKPAVWQEVLKEIEIQGPAYGRAELGERRRVLVEYVSANPTGPLHVGHGRGAAVGQAVANMLKAVGYDVVNEYYINDVGRQMKLLGASVYARYEELSNRPVEFPSEGYHGAYITAVAERVKQQLGPELTGRPAAEVEERCRTFAYRELLRLIREDLRSFGVEFESWFSEASLVNSGAVQRVLDELKSQQFLFEQEGAWWFRSSAFGDEKDRVVRKQDGEYTYLASDIAYHQDKLRRGYDLLIDVWGADHHGYIPRMQAVVQAYGYPKDRLQVVLVQMVNLLRGGKKVEMSKRAGEFITMREVIDEVGADGAGIIVWRHGTMQIAFTDHRGIYVIDAGGSSAKQFVDSGGTPVWSPDGSQLAYAGLMKPDDNIDIFITGDLGKTKTNISNDGLRFEAYPSWSNDGTKLVCITWAGDYEHATSSLELLDIRTKQKTTLATPGMIGYFLQ